MRPIVIGAGHNGLAAAFYLAKAGRKPLVLEASDAVGGGASTREMHPGFRVPTYTHEVLLHEDIVRDMQLDAHGLQRLTTDVERVALSPSGPPIVVYADAAKTAAALHRTSAADADAWRRYREAMTQVAGVLAPLMTAAPAQMTRPGLGDIWELLKAGRRFRRLGRRHAQDVLRWVPMPLYDFTHEWFETERLRALVAADGLSGSMLAPRSAGGTLALLLRLTHRHLAGGRPLLARGGPGACMQAMAAAATAAGAEIRTSSKVERILTGGGRITGVILNGREIACDAVLSSLDPKTTCLSLVDANAFPADFHQRIRNYRSAGTVAKVNLALDALPVFAQSPDQATHGISPEMLGGRIHIGDRLDDLERAFDHIKYGEMSEQPWLDISLPSVLDPSLAPAGGHVASIYVHNAPERLRGQDWSEGREVLLERTLRVLERVAPGVRSQIVATQVLTPADLAQQPGMWGGHIFHGELAPDQLMGLRPTIDSGTYRPPLDGLYLCGAGTHPGGFATGASGRLAVRHVLKNLRR